MVFLKSFTASDRSTSVALSQLAAQIDATKINPDLVCAFYECEHQDDAIFDFIKRKFPNAALLGGTSCGGVMSEAGLAGAN